MQPNSTPYPNPFQPGKANAQVGSRCSVCTLSHQLLAAVDQKLRAGDSTKSVHRWLQKNFPVEGAKISYGSVASHDRRHVKLLDRAAAKLSDGERARRQRIRLARDVLKGEVDPAAFFSPAEIARDLSRTSKRLDAAANDAFVDGEHASLAALSNSLIRTHELRGKLGGAIRENTAEVNVTVSLGELHARLDGVLSGPQGDRLSAAATLLGLPAPAPAASSSENLGVPMTTASTIEGETITTSSASSGPRVGPATPQPTPPPVMHSRKSSRRTD